MKEDEKYSLPKKSYEEHQPKRKWEARLTNLGLIMEKRISSIMTQTNQSSLQVEVNSPGVPGHLKKHL